MLERNMIARSAAALFPQGRIAVSALFLLNGFTVGSWAPKIPVFAARLGLSSFHLGLMILVFGLGSLAAMPLIGALVARFGSARVVRLSSLLLVPALLVLTLAPTIALAAIAIFILGALEGGMDIAMNSNAVVVERRMRRAIMSSCHGFWSLGGLIGASLGGVLMAGLGALGHVILVTLIGAAIVAYAWGNVEEDGPHPDEPHQPVRLPRSILPYLLGIVALFSMIPEGSVLDWGALYMRRELGADLVLSGFGFAAFSATMALMRFAGDPIRDRLGAVKTLRLCTVLALVGMLSAGLAPDAPVAIIGFAVAGIGISNMVPIAFSAAGNLPGLAPGIALSVVTFMGYSGILVAPSLIGFIAEHTRFHVIFTVLPALFLVVLALSGLARHADMARSDDA
ncbi:MAG TPA: MFS transporter [Pararhizobium sp.]|nr:MFS transporter [Pararhizobium sp.]